MKKTEKAKKTTRPRRVGLDEIVKRVFVGRKVRIKDGALVGIDFAFWGWENNGEVFTIADKLSNGRIKLVAPGYGEKGNYGNGAVYAGKADLLSV